MRERLVDWSKYQGKTNMKTAVEIFNLVGVMARCTIGHSYKDPYYDWNHRQAMELGVLFGAYHVARPMDRKPLEEVDWFKNSMTTDGQPPDFAVDDLELPRKAEDWKLITPKEVGRQIVLQVPAIRDRTGLPTFIYTGSWWWSGAAHIGSVTPLGIEADFPLIEAEYCAQSDPPGKVQWTQAPEHPRLPTPGHGWKPEDVLMWQWTSCLVGTGCGPDGTKYQDGDVLIPTYAEFLALLRKQDCPVSDKEKLNLLWEEHPQLHHKEA